MKMMDPTDFLRDLELPTLESILKNVTQRITQNKEEVAEKTNDFSQAYEEFKKEHTKILQDEEDQFVTSVFLDLILNLFEIPLLFHLSGMDGSAIIELYSILEILIKADIFDLIDFKLGESSLSKNFKDLLERRNLKSLIKGFPDIFDGPRHHTYIGELNQLRNLAAHKSIHELSEETLDINQLSKDEFKFREYLFLSINLMYDFLSKMTE